MRVRVELRHSYKLLNHGPTTLVSSAAGGRTNVMAAAWVMPLDFEPPRLAAVIAQGTYTRELVEASGEFTVSLPTAALLERAYCAGKHSGREGDKWALCGLVSEPASVVKAPLVQGCVGWLECRVLREPSMEEKYDLFVAEVLAAWADDEVFRDGEWAFGRDEQRTVHHLSKGTFLLSGAKVKVG